MSGTVALSWNFCTVIECWLVKILVKNALYLGKQVSEPFYQILLKGRMQSKQHLLGKRERRAEVYALQWSIGSLMVVYP